MIYDSKFILRLQNYCFFLTYASFFEKKRLENYGIMELEIEMTPTDGTG